jgi:hypothetical protein
MASTYSPNIAIELITEGEQAGAWGTTTNENWNRIEESSSYYAEVVVASTPFNWTLSDTEMAYTASTVSTTGSTGRAAFVEFTGSPGGATAINIRGNGTSDNPNRVFFAKNSLTGGHDITFDCGSGADFVLKHGCVAAVYTTAADGIAGNIFSNLQVGGLSVEEDGVIVFEGATDDAHETTLSVVDPAGDIEVKLPNTSDTLVGKATTDILTNKTLTTPTIGSFTNATHTHANAAGGGQITLGTGTTGNYVSTAVAGGGIDVSGATGDVTISIGSGEVTDAMLNDDVATGLAGAGTTATSGVMNVIGGSGITANANDIAVTPAQTAITSVLNAALVVGRDADNDIDFGTDDNIKFKVSGADQIQLSDGVLKPVTTNDVDLGTAALEFKDAWFDGTVTSDAFAGPLTGDVTGDVTGDLTGTASSATISAKVIVQNGSSSIFDNYLLFASNLGGSVGNLAPSSDSALKYIPLTGTLSTGPIVSGTLSATVITGTGLDVNGDLDLNGSSVRSSTNAAATSGESILLGKNAGVALTSGSAGGVVCIGDDAGVNLTTVPESVFIGSDAGKACTSGTGRNVSVGYQSMGMTTGTAATSHSNTALGWRALGFISESLSHGNVGIGSNACGGDNSGTAGIMSTGTMNIGIGYGALGRMDDASHNICIGKGSFLSSFSGTHEIVIGTNAAQGQGTDTVTFGRNTGEITSTTSGTPVWSSVSDERLKKNISDSSTGLDFINALRPVTYNFKQREDLDGSEEDSVRSRIAPMGEDIDGNPEELDGLSTDLGVGFIAQEVKAAIDLHGIHSSSSGWSESADGLQRVGAAGFIPSLVKAVQELSAQVAGLEARLAAIE